MTYTNSFTFADAIHTSTLKVVPGKFVLADYRHAVQFAPTCSLLFISLLLQIFMCWSQILCLLQVADQVPDVEF